LIDFQIIRKVIRGIMVIL